VDGAERGAILELSLARLPNGSRSQLPPLVRTTSLHATRVYTRTANQTVAAAANNSPSPAAAASHALVGVRRVRFFRNGDPYDRGTERVITARRYANFEALMADLAGSVALISGVPRNIFTPSAGHRVTALEQLRDGQSYVVAGPERLRHVPYGLHAVSYLPQFAHTQTVLGAASTTATNGLSRVQGTTSASPLPSIRARARARASQRRPQVPPAADSPAGGLAQGVPELSVSEAEHLLGDRPRALIVYRNGDPIFQGARVVISKRRLGWEQILWDMSDVIKLPCGFVRRLYSLSGVRITGLRMLLESQERAFVAAGLEEFKRTRYGSAPTVNVATVRRQSIMLTGTPGVEKPVGLVLLEHAHVLGSPTQLKPAPPTVGKPSLLQGGSDQGHAQLRVSPGATSEGVAVATVSSTSGGANDAKSPKIARRLTLMSRWRSATSMENLASPPPADHPPGAMMRLPHDSSEAPSQRKAKAGTQAPATGSSATVPATLAAAVAVDNRGAHVPPMVDSRTSEGEDRRHEQLPQAPRQAKVVASSAGAEVEVGHRVAQGGRVVARAHMLRHKELQQQMLHDEDAIAQGALTPSSPAPYTPAAQRKSSPARASPHREPDSEHVMTAGTVSDAAVTLEEHVPASDVPANRRPSTGSSRSSGVSDDDAQAKAAATHQIPLTTAGEGAGSAGAGIAAPVEVAKSQGLSGVGATAMPMSASSARNESAPRRRRIEGASSNGDADEGDVPVEDDTELHADALITQTEAANAARETERERQLIVGEARRIERAQKRRATLQQADNILERNQHNVAVEEQRDRQQRNMQEQLDLRRSFHSRDGSANVRSPPRQFESAYELGAEIGAGNFASVSVCTHRSSGRKYAVKMCDKRLVEVR
jgi:hypothetical protein